MTKKIRELTPKQRLFIKSYQLTQNATQAAINAGYSIKTADQIGSELLQKTRIKKAIERDIAAREHRLGIKVDKMLADLYAIATAKITDFYDIRESDGGEHCSLALKPQSEMSPAKLAAIESVQEIPTEFGSKITVKMHPKQAAAVFLLKYYGKYSEKQEHKHSGVVKLEDLVGGSMEPPPKEEDGSE